MFDIVIKAAALVDGTGAPTRTADIGVTDGIITEVGRISAAAKHTIDADGALTTPGWIDAHTHYDGQVTWDDRLEGSAANGVTTVVMGNCGVGFAPVKPGGVDRLIDLMEGVEDIPGTALHEGMPWGAWESFPEYLAFLDSRQWTLDVSAQIAHGALRFYVMGERAVTGENATEQEVIAMANLTEAAVRAGAIGFSTSRISAHKSMSGFCVPGTFAPEDELAAICRSMSAGGGAVLQAIPASAIGESDLEHSKLLDEVALLGRLSRRFGLPVTFSTFQHMADADLWRDVLSLTAAENAKGSNLAPMVGARGGSALTTLRGYHLFSCRPTFRKLAQLGHEAMMVELRKPAVKAAILGEADVAHPLPGSMENILPPIFREALPATFKMNDPIDYEPSADKSIMALAAREGRDPLEYMYDYLLGENGEAIGILFALNYAQGDLEAIRSMLADPNTVTGLSDAGAHVNFVCDMSIPTFNLTHWVRDRTRGAKLPVELVVAKSTSRPADVFGLHDRGRIEVGKRADINIVDLQNLQIQMPRMHHDLPAGGSRLLQLSTGYLATLVNGVITRRNDQDTGARPGRVARPGQRQAIGAAAE